MMVLGPQHRQLCETACPTIHIESGYGMDEALVGYKQDLSKSK